MNELKVPSKRENCAHNDLICFFNIITYLHLNSDYGIGWSRLLCAADTSGKVRIWDTTQKEHILKNEFHPLGGAIKDLAWTGDSQRIVVVGNGREKSASAIFSSHRAMIRI